jgi:hypothetical protein
VSKSRVTRTFFASLIAGAAGALIALISVGLAYANNVFVMSGPDVVDVRPSPMALALLVLGLVGIVAFIGGAIGSLIAWIGALLNTAQLQSKTWFVVLLLLGIFNCGILGMIAYVIAGPDGTRQAPLAVAAAPA